MKSFAICALIAAGVSAVPMAAPHHAHRHHKRDIVWVTETDVEIVTVPVMKTVWVDASAPTETANNQAYGGHGHRTSTSVSQPTSSASSSSEYSAPAVSSTTTSSVYVAPTTSSTTSAYVAPTTSSTSEYVAPTTSSTSEYVAPTTTSTSEYVAPTTTTTSAYVAPTTTSVYTPPVYTTTSAYVAPTTTTSEAAPTTTSSSSGGSGSYVGALSYYEVGLGSCGNYNTDDQMVVALDEDMMDKATMCGQMISITANGVTVPAQIVDTCPGCRGTAGLDLSPSLFAKFAPTASGIVPSATWSFT